MNSPIHLFETPSLGRGWLTLSRAILESGQPASYDGSPITELAHCSLVVEQPDPHDPLIEQLGDPAWLAWMHDNFFVQKPVDELGGAPSYAIRLFNYADQGRDQIRWVVERLKADPASRSAAITTFMPLSDTRYIPCISLLDFWLPGGRLELVVYAHSLDFGKKAYGNLVELAALQKIVADGLDRPAGRLVLHAKSAHVYASEEGLMRRLIQAAGVGPDPGGFPA
jgi:thymidylate synthase